MIKHKCLGPHKNEPVACGLYYSRREESLVCRRRWVDVTCKECLKLKGIKIKQDLVDAMKASRKWFVQEDEHSWQLFYGNQSGLMLDLQIIKAPKKNTPYAEYWPNAEQTKFIVDALNAAEKKRKK